jgi:tetratricopeptide (TPR) repeat protein
MRSLLALLAAALVFCQGAAAVTDGDRTQIYREFRELFDAHQYQEARPVAQKLVDLTEEQYSKDDRAMVNPLSNLAATEYRLKDYPAAEKAFTRCIEILEATAGNADRQLLRPLHGLGATYVAMEQYDDAIVPLKRAVDLSRNLDGLFNAGQLEYLEPLIASYVALGRSADAEKEQQYALRTAENTYGKSDVRMLGPLDRYARWLESQDHYAGARTVHERALEIAEQNGGKESLLTVAPLQGIARTYRLEFLNGNEQPSEDEDPFSSGNGLRSEPSNNQRLNPEGERALRLALERIDKARPVDHKLKGETLMEFGDWFLSGGGPKILDIYREAWKELAQAGATKPLETPRLIFYRGPTSSLKRSTLDPDNAELHYVEVSFTVTKDGHTANIVKTGSDAPESLQKLVINCVKKARYRPRFENGEPVETQGTTFRERLLLKKPKNRN